jgi:DNA-binding NtrC family response regulator
MLTRILRICDPSSPPRPWSGDSFLVEDSAPEDAPAKARSRDFHAAVIRLPLAERDVSDLILSLLAADPSLPVLVEAAAIPPSEAVRLARLGVWQFLDGTRDDAGILADAAQWRRVRPGAASGEARAPWERLLVGESREMRQIAHVIRMIGPRRATVLISGETGTGKELAARALHLAGPRRRGPFVAVNCSALPDNLLEAELFGHVRGAFTGALQARVGRFEEAHSGTLFLDEIGELPVELQAKLLRALQEREIQRLGSSETLRLDVRVVAATNADLPRKVEAGAFREDLFYRLNVVPLPMPPLRHRLEDLPLLIDHLIEKICAAEGLARKAVTARAVRLLAEFDWPGNVRQLENAIEMAVALSGDRAVLEPSDFRLPAAGPGGKPGTALRSGDLYVALPEEGLDFERTLTSIERSILEQALRRTGGNKKAAAEMLNLKRTTLAAKIRTLAASACN